MGLCVTQMGPQCSPEGALQVGEAQPPGSLWVSVQAQLPACYRERDLAAVGLHISQLGV